MKALISPRDDSLVVEVVSDMKVFDVAEPLYWVNCSSEIKAYQFKYVNNSFAPYLPQAAIPSTVSMRQARLALLQSNLLDEVNTAIATGTEADKITWEYATEVSRNDALVSNMATALNLSETDLDNLFTLANTL